jgi:hypothetical protein
MASARGDRKPCTHAECPGTMQFGREPLPQVSPARPLDGERGWVCSEQRGHFQSASEPSRIETAPSPAPAHQARWDDDGGSMPTWRIAGKAE